jgi:cytochrome c-type biogenesis protein CcmF
VIGSSLLLFAWRAPRVGLGGKFEAVSREAMLLGNNVLLLVAAASVLLGTLYPLIIDALGLGKLSVGPPYFNSVFIPLMVPALFLMGVAPLARWKHADLPELGVRLRWAFASSVMISMILPFVIGHWTPLIALGFLIAAWIVATLALNLRDNLGHAPDKAGIIERLSRPSRSYYGMQLAHLGIAVFVIGVTLVKGFETEKDIRMEPGDTVTIGAYTFRFDGVEAIVGPNYRAMYGSIAVLKDGSAVRTLHPEKRVYNASGTPSTEAAIDKGLFRDLYVSLGEPVSDGAWSVRVYYKPFVNWIWGGCVLMALGGLLAVSDRRYRVKSRFDSGGILIAAPNAEPAVEPAAQHPGFEARP